SKMHLGAARSSLEMSCNAVVLEPLGAGPEQPDDQLGRGIEGALGQVALGDAFGGLQRHLEHDVLAARHAQLPDRPALLDRRRHWAGIHDAGDDLLARATGNQEPDRLLAGQWHAALGAAKELRFADGLALGEQQTRLEAAESPFQKLARLVGAL